MGMGTGSRIAGWIIRTASSRQRISGWHHNQWPTAAVLVRRIRIAPDRVRGAGFRIVQWATPCSWKPALGAVSGISAAAVLAADFAGAASSEQYGASVCRRKVFAILQLFLRAAAGRMYRGSSASGEV